MSRSSETPCDMFLLTGAAEEADWQQHDWQNDHSLGKGSQICRGVYSLVNHSVHFSEFITLFTLIEFHLFIVPALTVFFILLLGPGLT